MKKPTLRQLKAEKTRQRINRAAIYLFDKQGFENTTIEDICIKAGISVGTLYHYYPSKSDIFCMVYRKIDEYYEKTVQKQLISTDFHENIILYFKHYADFNSAKGIEAVKQLFYSQNKFILDESCYMYQMLIAIVESAKERKLTEGGDIKETVDLLLVMARGVLYDWVMHDGDYHLADKMVEYISKLKAC